MNIYGPLYYYVTLNVSPFIQFRFQSHAQCQNFIVCHHLKTGTSTAKSTDYEHVTNFDRRTKFELKLIPASQAPHALWGSFEDHPHPSRGILG